MRAAAVPTAAGFAVCVTAVIAGLAWAQNGPPDLAAMPAAPVDVVAKLYQSECAVCHGEALQGAAQGTPLIGGALRHGDTVAEIAFSTAGGFPDTGMPAWAPILSADQIHALGLYIAEQRAGTNLADFRYAAPLALPSAAIRTERVSFAVEPMTDGLDPLPFSIAPLPDGRILVTERMRGLGVIAAGGGAATRISGTPRVYDDAFKFGGQPMGLGWMMDVAPHPEFADSGWIYLHFGDRCMQCNAPSRENGQPVSMNKVVRGKLKDGAWIEQQTVWQADIETYSAMPEIAAGGRLAFDGDGHLFFSVGMKGPQEHIGVQDLGLPYGKVMRVRDDGSMPEGNPFAGVAGALPEIWTYGHRNPQGLEYDMATHRLWSTEMGPRGGDEVNLLEPGRNYGWPLVSKGVNYDGTPIAFAHVLGLEFDSAALVPPIADLTPAPAVSSFVVYRGAMFPEWDGDLIVGTLRASDLYRMEVRGGQIVGSEELLTDVARIRDIEVGVSGEILVLLEHDSGGRIVKLVRVPD